MSAAKSYGPHVKVVSKYAPRAGTRLEVHVQHPRHPGMWRVVASFNEKDHPDYDERAAARATGEQLKLLET